MGSVTRKVLKKEVELAKILEGNWVELGFVFHTKVEKGVSKARGADLPNVTEKPITIKTVSWTKVFGEGKQAIIAFI